MLLFFFLFREVGPWPSPQIPTTGNSRHELAQQEDTPYLLMHHPLLVPTAAVKPHSELTWASSLTVQPKAGFTPTLISVPSQFVQGKWPCKLRKLQLEAGGMHWLCQQLLSVVWQRNPSPAVYRAFSEHKIYPSAAMQHQALVLQRMSTITLFVLTFFQLFHWTATSKSHKAGPSLHGQEHQLTLTHTGVCPHRWSYISQHLPQLRGLGKRSTSLLSTRACTEWLLLGHKSLFCVRTKNWVTVSKLLEVLLSK